MPRLLGWPDASIDRCLIGAEAGLAGANDRLRPIRDLQLAEDVRHVVLHRLDAQHQHFGDLMIAAALRDQA